MAASKATSGPSKPNGTRDSRSPSPDFDPVAFQASLDDAVNETRALVDSWLPKDLGPEWTSAFAAKKGADGLQSLKDRARPPRLGLGAQPASQNKQLAEDRKLKQRLMGKSRMSIGDDGSEVKATLSAGKGVEGDLDDDEEDEEDSRAKTVGKGKGKAGATGYTNPFVIPAKKNAATPARATPSKTAGPSSSSSSKSKLFNDPSPVKPAPSTSTTTAKPLVAATSFYGPSTSAPAANGQPLSKNQRKKLREREKQAQRKRQLEEESRKEAEGEAAGERPPKRAKVEVDGAKDERDVAADGEADASMASADPPTPSKEAVAATGGGDTPSKKKRRKKKKKSGAADGAGGGNAAPLLNLAPLAHTAGPAKAFPRPRRLLLVEPCQLASTARPFPSRSSPCAVETVGQPSSLLCSYGMLPLRLSPKSQSARHEEDEQERAGSASQEQWETMPMTPQPEPPLDWKRPVLMAGLFLLALLAYASWTSEATVKSAVKTGHELVVPSRAEENVDVCSGPAGCRFLVPIAIGEQESRAQLHLIQLAHLSVVLDRTLVLPRAYSSRFSSCGQQSFDFFYSVPPFLQAVESAGGYAVVQRDFEKWLEAQDERRTAQRVRLQVEGQYGATSTEGRLELDPNAAEGQSCLPEEKLDFDGRERLWAVEPLHGTNSSVVGSLVNLDRGISSDVLLMDYNLRTSLVHSKTPIDIDAAFRYQHEWQDLASRVLEAAGPAVGVHWRTESIEPPTLESCGGGLVDALLALKASNPTLESVYFATDYPLETLSDAPSNAGHEGRLDEDDEPVAHSDTLTTFLTPAHREAMSSFLHTFQTLAAPHGLKLSTYRSLIHSLSSSLPPSLASWASNPAAPAIVSQLVLRQTDYFLAGLPDTRRTKAEGKTACAKNSNWTNRVVRARSRTWEEQEGPEPRELRNIVGRWKSDGSVE
uniref:BY PROTMAP: gi/342321161/gb/EGU13096.1/ Proteophosphoglycan 5 [Rhodotorula glutinis ATCC 204091] n=1 Tax=Rhodotorula toruloides TaxID=5286 RepID=A0A0K3CSP8_RHOTO